MNSEVDAKLGFRNALAATVVGFWLGMVQVDLGVSVMQGAGAAAILFYAMVTAWIAGAAMGVLWRRFPTGVLGFGGIAMLVAIALYVGQTAASGRIAQIFGLVASLAAGGFAGAYIRSRAAMWGRVRSLLFHENNGFVGGYCYAALMLMFYRDVLDVTVVVVAIAVFPLLRKQTHATPTRTT